MSAPTGDDQFIQLTPEEAFVTRGAVNVLRELAADPDVEPSVAVPLDSGREPTYSALLTELEGEASQAIDAGLDTFRMGLTPAMAQAVRDAVGVLGTLLQDPAGRGMLAEIGFLADPDTPVDPAEFEQLESIADRIEPTGARPGAGPQPGEELIDPSLPAANNAVRIAEMIAQAEVPWPGFEQARFRLDSVVRTFSGGDTTLECDVILSNLAEVTALAVTGQARIARGDVPGASREIIGEWPVDVDEAFTAVMSSVETKHCVSRNAQDTLWTRIDELTYHLTPGSSPENVRAVAQQLLVDLRSVAEAPTDFTLEEADDDRLLRHIDQLRENLEETVQQFPITDEETLEAAILELRPSSRAGCSDYLVSLAELAVVAARVAAIEDDRPRLFNALKSRVAHERRVLLDRMGFGDVAVDEPLPTPQRECAPDESLRRVRNSFISIMDPIEDDPDDVDLRAFAAISDIRELFLDPRRGP